MVRHQPRRRIRGRPAPEGDTLHCAIKASYAKVDGNERPIRKETKGKTSKRGLLSVEQTEEGELKVFEDGTGNPEANLLQLVFKDGKRLRTETLSGVRERVDAAHKKLRTTPPATTHESSDAKSTDAAVGIA